MYFCVWPWPWRLPWPACGGTDDSQQDTNEPQQNNADQTEPTTDDTATVPQTRAKRWEAAEIQVFIAASLDNAFQEIIQLYNETQPNITVRTNADSSGTLLTQIQEGYSCDLFFSAATAQMDTLEADGLPSTVHGWTCCKMKWS